VNWRAPKFGVEDWKFCDHAINSAKGMLYSRAKMWKEEERQRGKYTGKGGTIVM